MRTRFFATVMGLSMLGMTSVSQAVPFTIDFDPVPTVSTTGGLLNPSDQNYVDGPFRVNFFWMASAGFIGGHAHSTSGVGGTNAELQHFNGSSDLQGFVIERTDLQPFSLTSLAHRVTATNSIAGFSPGDVNILLAESFNPANAVASEFTGFGVGGSAATFSTLAPGGFENITRLFISSSASTTFDNIVLDDAFSVPEPTPLALLGLSLAGLGFARRRRRAA